MAWLDFIRRIRQDEEEEKNRPQGGMFGFLDDVLDVGERRAERVGRAFSRNDDPDYDIGNRFQDVIGGLTPEPVKDITGFAAGLGREIVTKPLLKLGQTVDEAQTDSRPENIDELLKFSETERNELADKAERGEVKEGPGVMLALSRRKFGDISDKALKERQEQYRKEREDRKKPYTPDTTWEKALFGNEDIHSVQGDVRIGKEQLAKRGVNEPVAGAGGALYGLGLAALDTPFGKPVKIATTGLREIGQEGVERLIKSDAPEEIMQQLSKSRTLSGYGEDALREASQKISQATDKKSVTRAINETFKTSPKTVADAATPQVITRSPLESDDLAEQVTRGRLSDTTEVVPINSLRIGSDALGDMDGATVNRYADDVAAGNTVDPLIVSEKNGQLFVQDGKHRLAAMERAGVTEVPIVRQVADTPPAAATRAADTTPARRLTPLADEMAQEYRSPDELVNDTADSWYQYDKTARGGQKIPDGEGGYKRTTEHTPFYSRFYTENGRPPSREVYREAARQQFERGSGDLVEQDLVDAYGLIKNRGDEMAALDQAAPPAQQFTDIVTRPVQNRRADLVEGGRQRTRSFLRTIQEKGPTSPELKQAASEVTPSTYQQQAQAPVMEAAKKRVDEDYQGALKYVKENKEWNDEKAATLQQLVVKAQNEGRTDDALDLLEEIDISGRQTGRGNAMLAAWSRLSPEGVLRFAKREVAKAQEEGGKGVLNKLSNARKEKPEKLAQKIKQEVEKVGQVTGPKVDDVVKRVANAADETKSVGEKVAKNIESYMTPAKKKKADELVNELTKKIKQELIEKKAKTPGKSAQDVLREVFGRNKEALEAMPEAQAILRERFKDNPRVLEQLDTMLKSTLDIPAAKSTVSRAVKDVMKTNEVKISKIIKESWFSQRQSVEDIATALTKEGFDKESATAIAKEVTSQLNKEIGDAKKKVLDRMLKDVPERARPTFEGKVAKLSNLGALDDKDYLSIARKQLDLPDLDSATAGKISRLAQDMQKLPDGDEKNRIIAEIMDTIADTMPPTAKEKFNAFRYQNLLSSPRTQLRNVVANTFNTLVTRPATLFTGVVGDVTSSALTRKPRERYLRELPDYYQGIFKGFFDAQEAMAAAWKGTADITNPDLAEQFGKGGIQAARMKNLPKKFTVVSRLMEAQDKMFSGMIAGGEYAAQIRRGVPEAEAKKAAHEMAEYSLLRQALDPRNESGQGKFLSAIDRTSQWILDGANRMPGGRWVIPFVRTPLNFAKQWLEFSPVGLANAGLTRSMSPERRIEALNKGLLGTSLVGFGATLAADDRVTWSVPENERDRDLFYAEGKKPYSIKVGDKWVPLINFGPFGLAMALPAAVKHNFADSPASTDDNFADKMLATTLDIGEMLSQQTFLNGVGNVLEALQGGKGDQVEKVLAGLASQAIPLSGMVRYISTAIDPTYREAQGFVQTLTRDIPGLSKTLQPQTNSVTGEEVRRNWSDYAAPYSIGAPNESPTRQANTEMAAEFYRSITRGNNGRTKTSEAITKALSDNNPQEAQRLTVEHNQQVVNEMNQFAKKFGDQLKSRPDLQEEFRSAIQSALIPLNQRSVNTRLRNQAEKREFSEMLNR